MLRLLPYVIIALLALTISRANGLIKQDFANFRDIYDKILVRNDLLAQNLAKNIEPNKSLMQVAQEGLQSQQNAVNPIISKGSLANNGVVGEEFKLDVIDGEYRENWDDMMVKRDYCINLLEKTEFNREEINILQKLRKKNEEAQVETEKNEAMRVGLDLMKKEIQNKLENLEKIRSEIKLNVKNNEGPNLNKLMRIYENMRPEDSAKIFNLMDNDVLIDMAENMKESKFAAILAKMDLKKVEELNKMINYRRIIFGN